MKNGGACPIELRFTWEVAKHERSARVTQASYLLKPGSHWWDKHKDTLYKVSTHETSTRK